MDISYTQDCSEWRIVLSMKPPDMGVVEKNITVDVIIWKKNDVNNIHIL